ncbi:DUF4040 domain-containing protein [Oscillatoriales cyanobacterium LEGE 11467]|uniref:DUF4040 domain-containing protein n=1 Tax=Zarconia navalis LEGE 11467 TaxID=1828826 RepID=A0A928Z8C4_9CYAN|nr:DUF4040 domain-containing protein [Zarconia navalis]MBE9039701.1 DUF4040 domain-containing protein [Zarconia navalis LEGE 11467]
MSEQLYIIPIVLLLPLTGCMLVLQVNPYHALVIRGIFGAIAALVYVLFGAADVALTEALVGTMLSITLYAVAVRSSLSLRVGAIEDQLKAHTARELLSVLRATFSKHHLRLEIVPYTNLLAMQAALRAKEIHCSYVLSEPGGSPSPPGGGSRYDIQTRVSRLYEIMQAEVPPTKAYLRYIDLANPDKSTEVPIPEAMEGKS